VKDIEVLLTLTYLNLEYRRIV